MGAQVLIILASFPRTPAIENMVCLRARENFVHAVFVNSNGPPFNGDSYTVHPTGKLLTSTRTPMFTVMEKKEIGFFIERKKQRFEGRNPALYNAICE